MHILLLGSNGQVGSALLKQMPQEWTVTAWSRADIDFADTAGLRTKINDYGRTQGAPHFVINAAAYTKVDLAESNPTEATKLNLDLPEVLAEATLAWNSKLIHYSTDYVFNGAGDEPHLEFDDKEPLNLYGKTKFFGDQAIMASGCQYLIFRTSWVYARTGKNFLLTMLGVAADKESLRVVADQVGSPTLADDIAKITIQVMQKTRDQDPFPAGVYHLTNQGFTSWHGFAEAIIKEARANGMKIVTNKVVPIQTKDYPTPAKRPLNSRLSIQKFIDTFGITPRPWQEAMKEVILSLKKGS